MRPYISVDLETTGVNLEKSEILEIGAVYDDGVSAIESLTKMEFIIQLDVITHAEPYAVNMNARLFKAMARREGVSLMLAFDSITELFRQGAIAAAEWDQANKFNPRNKIYIAGKNAASFDIPILKSFLKRHEYPSKVLFDSIHYQVLDVGSMYYAEFGGRIPSLSEISARAGRAEVTHKALDDAMDVVYATRAKMKDSRWATIGDKINGT
jgi:oligoribonuclease (3'-5' exoribonuclease)